MKRSEKKLLKGDEFVSGLGHILEFIKTHKKELLIFAAGVVVLALAYLGVIIMNKSGLRKESRIAGEIIALRADLDKKPENVARLEKLAGNGRFSRLAYLELATYWMQKGDLDKAENQAGRVKSTPKDVIYYQAQDFLAQIAVKKKNFSKALEIYRKMENEKPRDYPVDALLFHKGEALEQKGDTQEALAVFKKLQDEYKQTYFGYEAALKVGKLSAGR